MQEIFCRFVVRAVIIGIFFFNSYAADACTELKLSYDHHNMIGHNFDWPNKYGFIVINPMGITRHSLCSNNSHHFLKWVSKYGSVTIDLSDQKHQVIKQAVISGINQAGLSASILWLQNSGYPKETAHLELDTGQWVQYILDNAATVSEAITLVNAVDVEPTVFHGQKILVHLLVHDAQDHSAVMEYINGKLNLYQNKDLPIPVLTNTSYLTSLQSLKYYRGFGGDSPLPGGYDSAARFVLAANFLKNLPTTSSHEQALANTFNALGYLIEIPGSSTPTVWSIVYDLSDPTLYYRDIDNPNLRFIHLNRFNFSKGQPVRVLAINNNFQGDTKMNFKVIDTDEVVTH